MSAANPLRHLRASTANKRPLPAGMADGQLALNTNDGSPGLFFKDNNGALVKVGPVHVGATAPNASPASGGQTGNSKGEQWLDTSGANPVLRIWDGSAWQSQADEFVNASGDVMTGALGIIAGTATAPGLYVSGDTNTGLFSLGADQLAIATGGTGRLFVDSGGRIMAGTSTALTNAYAISTALTPAVQIQGNTSNAAALSITRNTSAAANLLLQRGVTGTPVVDTDPLGQISFNGFDGANYFNAALIRGVVDGTPGTGAMPGRLSFQTTPAGSTTPLERLRIGPAGQIMAAALGTVAAPIWSFTGDPDTGVYSPGADQVAIATGGVQRLLINASGTVSATTFSGSLTGNASTASTLQTARTINGVSFNGSANINVPDLRADNGTVLIDGTGVTSAVNYTTLTNAATGGTVTISTAGTDTNVPLRITTKGAGALTLATIGGNISLRPGTAGLLLYDDSNTYYHAFSTGTMTANRTLTLPNANVTLVAGTMVPTTGTGATGSWAISVTGSSASCTGNAATATTLQTARTINGTSFNGSANITTASWGTARTLWGQSVDGSANETGPLYPAAGSVTAPAFSTSGDTNTGIYFPAADTIGFSINGTQRGQFTSTGALRLFPNGTGPTVGTADDQAFLVYSANASKVLSIFLNDNTSYASTLVYAPCGRAGSSAYSFINCDSAGGTDREFTLRGDGNAFADGTWSGGGADYAEFFEWSDGNTDAEDRRGISVVLDGDMIRPALAGEDPIGVISGNPSVTGDSAWNKWSGKHLTDDFGTYIQEEHQVIRWLDENDSEVTYEDWNLPDDLIIPADAEYLTHDEKGNRFTHRKVNPDYDPSVEYIPREQRPEWDAVGLMGKLRLRKGQPVGSRWIKMRDISDTVEEWLVR